MRRRSLQLIVAFLVTILPLLGGLTQARADNASSLLSLVNTLRATHGAAPLAADPTLTRVAQAWSVHMASGAGLVHNPNVAAALTGPWHKLGENVGEGGSISILFNAFSNSPVHLENMTDPTYNLTGIGVAVGQNGTLWVTEDFEAVPTGTTATTTPPATTPSTTRPVVVTTTPTTVRPQPVTKVTAAPPTTAAPVPATTTTVAPPPTTVATPASTVTTSAIAPTTSKTTVAGPMGTASSLAAHRTAPPTDRNLLIGAAITALVGLGGAAFFVRRSIG